MGEMDLSYSKSLQSSSVFKSGWKEAEAARGEGWPQSIWSWVLVTWAWAPREMKHTYFVKGMCNEYMVNIYI